MTTLIKLFTLLIASSYIVDGAPSRFHSSSSGVAMRRSYRRQLIGIDGVPQPPPGTGTQFITGKCNVDNDCASGCCETKKKTCRAPAALQEGVEFCGNGFSPNFNPQLNAGKKAPANQNNNDDDKADNDKNDDDNNNQQVAAPQPGSGKQFITGSCSVDNDCASGCCETKKKTCRAPLSLKEGIEFCGNGFTTNFNGGGKNTSGNNNAAPQPGAGKQFITGPCQNDSDCASGCCETNKKTCRAKLSLKEGVEFCGNGFTTNFSGGASKSGTNTASNNAAPQPGAGKQFITGPCQNDSDCASGCCETKKKTCRAPLSLKEGEEFCGNSFTTNFNGGGNKNAGSNSGSNNAAPQPGAGKQFITGPCQNDSDCASGCCETSKKTCRAKLSLKEGVEFCGNGFTTNFNGGGNNQQNNNNNNNNQQNNNNGGVQVVGKNVLPPPGTGTQFITGKCSVDNDCVSGCCETKKKTCRAPLALSPGVEFCGNGFSPRFD